MNSRSVRFSKGSPTLLILVSLFVVSFSALAQQPPVQGCKSVTPDTEQKAYLQAERKKLFRIEVEDAVEVGLIEQQLKLRPELVRGRSFYYCGNEEINELVEKYGYEPSAANPEETFSRVVRVVRKGSEEELRDLGVTVILREAESWVVRGTLNQLRVLRRVGYQVEELGRKEPRPRQVQVIVSSQPSVVEVGKLGVDIYNVTKTGEEYVIYGGAFDDAIDELRAHGFVVKVEPYPSGVIP